MQLWAQGRSEKWNWERSTASHASSHRGHGPPSLLSKCNCKLLVSFVPLLIESRQSLKAGVGVNTSAQILTVCKHGLNVQNSRSLCSFHNQIWPSLPSILMTQKDLTHSPDFLLWWKYIDAILVFFFLCFCCCYFFLIRSQINCQDDLVQTQPKSCGRTSLKVCFTTFELSKEETKSGASQTNRDTCQTTPYPPWSAKIPSTACLPLPHPRKPAHSLIRTRAGRAEPAPVWGPRSGFSNMCSS